MKRSHVRRTFYFEKAMRMLMLAGGEWVSTQALARYSGIWCNQLGALLGIRSRVEGDVERGVRRVRSGGVSVTVCMWRIKK